MTPNGIIVDRDCCVGCGTCADACPANAMELLGTQTSMQDLYGELIKDNAYYDKSGGGVTASGGEPTLQPAFVAELFKKLQADGIHTALDTCGLCFRHTIESILPHTDLVLFDLKELDTEKHRQYTGQDNQIIIQSLLFIKKYLEHNDPQLKLWIRTPLIPEATANKENLTAIGVYLAQNLAGCIERWELCAFNNLCCDKYRRLDHDWPYKDMPLMSKDEVEQCEIWAGESGFDPALIFATGATRVETF